jgi:YegS/Rv2252/BmrU family lipid kinase
MTDSLPASKPPRRLLVIHNPVAGSGRAGLLERSLRELEDLGCALRVRATENVRGPRKVAENENLEDVDVVVAAGGDGTINEVINGLCARAARPPSLAIPSLAIPPLAILPLGTANVLAREIGAPSAPRALAQMIAAGPARAIALGQVGERRFVQMLGAGLDARVVDGVDRNLALKRRLGKGAYLWHGLAELSRFAERRYRVTIDGESHLAHWVIVANGRFWAGRFLLASEASLAAPVFQVCLFQESGLWSQLRYGAGLLTGRLETCPGYRVIQAAHLTIEGPAGEAVQGDGDVIARLPVEIRVLPQALRLIMPA